jgi:hypothetical protein
MIQPTAIARYSSASNGASFCADFLVVVCAAFSIWDLKGIVLVAFVWGVWHGMMQTYGFAAFTTRKSVRSPS